MSDAVPPFVEKGRWKPVVGFFVALAVTSTLVVLDSMIAGSSGLGLVEAVILLVPFMVWAAFVLRARGRRRREIERLSARPTFELTTRSGLAVLGLVALAVGIALSVFALFGASLLEVLPASTALMLVASRLAGFLIQQRIHIGADGLRVVQRSRERFVPFAAIRSVRQIGFDIELDLADGTREAWGGSYEHVNAFAEALRAADAEYRRRQTERRERAAPVLSSAEGDYREAAYPTDVLLRIAEDPTEDIDSRQAAVKWLAKRTDYDYERLRVAAESTASPELRDALDELASVEPAHRRVV